MRTLFALTAVLAMSAGTAIAQPTSDWSGFYVGVNGGGAWGTTDTSLRTTNEGTGFFDVDNIPGVNAAGSNHINTSGALAGAQVGYVWQDGKAVLGVEAAFDWTDLKGSRSRTQGYFDGPTDLFTVRESPHADGLFTVLGRAGYDMGSWYPYLTAGVAVADLKYGFNYTDLTFAPGCTNCAATISRTEAGFAGGAGFAAKLNSNWSLRGEYLYVAFANFNGASKITGTTSDTGTSDFAHSARFSESVLRVALDYRFGPGS